MLSRIPRNSDFWRTRASGAALVTALLSSACGSQGGKAHVSGTPPTPDQIPESISILGGPVSMGTARGPLRKTLSVGEFRAGRYPVTVARYRQCVTAGACSEPSSKTAECASPGAREWLDRSTYGIEGGDQLPVTCVGVEQARTYCQWVGADLPTMAQWELAARGNQPTQFSWGTRPATCAEHPAAGETRESSPCLKDSTPIAIHSVGAHHPSASPFGLEDVLLTSGELLLASPDAQFSACQSPAAGCAVQGSMPGAIEGFSAIAPESSSAQVAKSAVVSSFRCVWSEPK